MSEPASIQSLPRTMSSAYHFRNERSNVHIPDAYLSPATEAVATLVMVPMWVVASRKTACELTSKQAPLLSIGAAFCFAIQMFNIPAIGGTTAHALGAVLLAILVGPWAAMLGMTLTLAIQALLFGDGGILSLGANCFDMALVAPFAGYAVYSLIAGKSSNLTPRRLFAAGLGAYAGAVCASLSAGVLLGVQPSIAHDAIGHALYCPFGLHVTVPAMVLSHLLVAGPAEAIITVATLGYLWKTFPEFSRESATVRVGTKMRLAGKLAWVLALTPIGLWATGTAFGEWELSELKQMVGYEPAGIANAHSVILPLLPDYSFAGLSGKPWEILGYLVSALIGCCVIALFTRRILGRGTSSSFDLLKPGIPSSAVPNWMTLPNPPVATSALQRTRWFESTLLKMRTAIEKTFAAEEVARKPGFLQSIHPMAKSVGFASAIVATGLAQSEQFLAFLIASVLVAAAGSQVPLRSFIERVVGSVLFFGLIVAAPISMKSVTSGPVAFSILGLDISTSGLHCASMILLRLAAGISLAMLWNLTTRWHEMLRSLKTLGVPQFFLATAALTYRYLFVFIETLAEMVEARTSRQVGACSKVQARQFAGNGGAILFAKSLAFTDEMHLAMQSRSVDVSSKKPKFTAWKPRDFGAALTGILCLVVIALLGHIHAF